MEDVCMQSVGLRWVLPVVRSLSAVLLTLSHFPLLPPPRTRQLFSPCSLCSVCTHQQSPRVADLDSASRRRDDAPQMGKSWAAQSARQQSSNLQTAWINQIRANVWSWVLRLVIYMPVILSWHKGALKSTPYKEDYALGTQNLRFQTQAEG